MAARGGDSDARQLGGFHEMGGRRELCGWHDARGRHRLGRCLELGRAGGGHCEAANFHERGSPYLRLARSCRGGGAGGWDSGADIEAGCGADGERTGFEEAALARRGGNAGEGRGHAAPSGGFLEVEGIPRKGCPPAGSNNQFRDPAAREAAPLGQGAGQARRQGDGKSGLENRRKPLCSGGGCGRGDQGRWRCGQARCA